MYRIRIWLREDRFLVIEAFVSHREALETHIQATKAED